MVVGGWISCEWVNAAKFPWPVGGPINGFHYYKLKLIKESGAHSDTTNELLISSKSTQEVVKNFCSRKGYLLGGGRQCKFYAV